MANPYSFINPQAQPYETIKNSLNLGPHAASKFDTLNAHVRNTVVMPGELILLGDGGTASSTSHEAFMMTKALEIHRALVSGGVRNGFIHDNFEIISAMLGHSALGIGAASGTWSKHLQDIQQTLVDIDALHRQSLGQNSILSRNEFITRRRILFDVLDLQLRGFAGLGSGLRNTSGVRKMLGISTKSYLHQGEIPGYADKIAKVSKAARFMKAGGHVGIALDMTASGLAIYQACSLGREEECTKAKYLEGGKLGGSLLGGAAGGALGAVIANSVCVVALGALTAGWGIFACVLFATGVGGYGGGVAGGALGESAGLYIYKQRE